LRSFRFAADANGRRQDGIERCNWCLVSIAPGTALAARTQAALRTRFAHEGVFGGIADRLTFIGAHGFGCDDFGGLIGTRTEGLARFTVSARLALFPRLTLFSGLARLALFPSLARFAVLARFALFPRFAGFTRFPILARFVAAVVRAVECGEIGIHAKLHRLVFGLLLAPTLARLALALLVNAYAAVGDHAEIVIGKLEVIFGLNTVPIEVRVLCQLAIFFEHLGRIAPRAAIDPVQLLAAALRARIVSATATAVVVPAIVVVQVRHFPNSVQPLAQSFSTWAIRGATHELDPAKPAAAHPPPRAIKVVVPSICVFRAKMQAISANGGTSRDGKPSSVALLAALIREGWLACQAKCLPFSCHFDCTWPSGEIGMDLHG